MNVEKIEKLREKIQHKMYKLTMSVDSDFRSEFKFEADEFNYMLNESMKINKLIEKYFKLIRTEEETPHE